jgi:hypothetical protein
VHSIVIGEFENISVMMLKKLLKEHHKYYCCYSFMVHHNFKVSQSARRVSAANAMCNDTDLYNKDYITLIFCNNVYTQICLLCKHSVGFILYT